MIKIVGQDYTVAKRVTCKNCGAILEYTKSDLRDAPEGIELTPIDPSILDEVKSLMEEYSETIKRYRV